MAARKPTRKQAPAGKRTKQRAKKTKPAAQRANTARLPRQLDKISRLPVPPVGRLDADLRKYFRVCQERLGLVPNVLRAFALRPAKLRVFIAKYDELMLTDETRLSRLEREMIAVTVSSCNHCVYCITSHGAAVREFSGDPALGDILATNYREASLSRRHRAMLDYAWKLTETPWLIEEADRAALRKAGFSDEDIFDITDTASYFNYTNRMSRALGLQPNREYLAHGR